MCLTLSGVSIVVRRDHQILRRSQIKRAAGSRAALRWGE